MQCSPGVCQGRLQQCRVAERISDSLLAKLDGRESSGGSGGSSGLPS